MIGGSRPRPDGAPLRAPPVAPRAAPPTQKTTEYALVSSSPQNAAPPPDASSPPASPARADETFAHGAPRRAGLVVVYLTVFLDLLGFGLLLPLLPFYALKFGAQGLWVGVLSSAFSLAQLVSAPVLGRLSDRYGRRPVVLACLLGSAGALVVTGLAQSLWLLILGRALSGLFAGSISAAQAYVADVTRPEERARYMGLVGACIGLGFVFGPLLGSELSRFGFGGASFAAAALCLANFLFALAALPESRRRARSPSDSHALSFGRLIGAVRRPQLGRLLVAGALGTLAFVAFETTFALLAQARFGLGPSAFGRIFGGIGVVIVIVQGGLVGRLVRRYGERVLALTGAILLGTGFLILPWLGSLRAVLAAVLVIAAAQGLISPSLSSLLSRASRADDQGGVLGVGQSLASGARALGPLIAGFLYDRAAPLPYVFSALVLAAVAVLLARPSESAVPAAPSPATDPGAARQDPAPR